jgi:NarL family two-component system response regulator YdfI
MARSPNDRAVARETRVLVAAASPVVRAGLEALVRESARLSLAGGSSDLAALARRVERLLPDVVLIEVEHLDREHVAMLSGIGKHADGLPGSRAAPPLVVLSDDPEGRWTLDVLRSGARAILPHQATSLEIEAAVEAAAAGLVSLRADTADSLLVARASVSGGPSFDGPSSPVLRETLTPREIQVLGMLAEGWGTKGIATSLGISEHTVKFHVASILSKLDASSRTEAVTLGLRLGLIML